MSDLGERACEALHALRLRGLYDGLDDAALDELCGTGLAVRKDSLGVLTESGRAANAAWARYADGSEEQRAVERSYAQFLPFNEELLVVSTAWQVRTGNVPNDHRDTKYDWDVIDRLVKLDERAGPVVRRLGKAVSRFVPYRPLLTDALQRVQAGEHDWFVSPRVDSYHTVWMRLHEDLLLALGRERASESEATSMETG